MVKGRLEEISDHIFIRIIKFSRCVGKNSSKMITWFPLILIAFCNETFHGVECNKNRKVCCHNTLFFGQIMTLRLCGIIMQSDTKKKSIKCTFFFLRRILWCKINGLMLLSISRHGVPAEIRRAVRNMGRSRVDSLQDTCFIPVNIFLVLSTPQLVSHNLTVWLPRTYITGKFPDYTFTHELIFNLVPKILIENTCRDEFIKQHMRVLSFTFITSITCDIKILLNK